MRQRISAVTALTLILGFAAASVTGNRALGGAVLVLGGAVCTWWMLKVASVPRTAGLLVAVLALFAVSHPLGHVIGPWPSVVLVAAIAGGLAYILAKPPALAEPSSRA